MLVTKRVGARHAATPLNTREGRTRYAPTAHPVCPHGYGSLELLTIESFCSTTHSMDVCSVGGMESFCFYRFPNNWNVKFWATYGESVLS